MTNTFKVIGVEGKEWIKFHKRETCQPATFYVAGVCWAEGDGMQARKITTTRDRRQAARFSAATADVLAEQLADRRRFGLFPTIEQA